MKKTAGGQLPSSMCKGGKQKKSNVKIKVGLSKFDSREVKGKNREVNYIYNKTFRIKSEAVSYSAYCFFEV